MKQAALLLVLLICLVACGGGAASDAPEPTHTPPAVPPTWTPAPPTEVSVSPTEPPAEATPAPDFQATVEAADQAPGPEFAATWDPWQVVAAFQAAGLEATDAREMGPEDYGLAPYLGQGVHFLIPSLCADCGGRVFALNSQADVDALREYYVRLGESSAAFFSWTFTRDNILVQLNGDLPDEQASVYEATLNLME